MCSGYLRIGDKMAMAASSGMFIAAITVRCVSSVKGEGKERTRGRREGQERAKRGPREGEERAKRGRREGEERAKRGGCEGMAYQQCS